jgi:hypothetical protein
VGAIKTEKLANGNIGLEITYGGLEAPFGGIDSSMPPAYIDPKCAVTMDGILVVDNKLVASSFQLLTVPTLWNGVEGVILLAFGTFYNSLLGQLNYVFGYIATPFGVPETSPTGVNYVFYITSWNPSNISEFWNDTLKLTLFDSLVIEQQASITLDLIPTNYTFEANPGTGAVFQFNYTSVPGAPTVQVGGYADVTYWVTLSNIGTGYQAGAQYSIIQGPSTTPAGPEPYNTVSALVNVTSVNGSGGITGFTIMGTASFWNTSAPANFTLPLGSDTSAVVALTITNPYSNNSYGIGVPYTYTYGVLATDTVGSIVAALVTIINNINSNPLNSIGITASASEDGTQIIITPNNSTAAYEGVNGNSITVLDVSANSYPSEAPPFYFSNRIARNLEGGISSTLVEAPRSFNLAASVTNVGGTLYFANLGPIILKFSGTGLFTTSTLYNGMGVIRKFAGSLIGLRLIPQIGSSVKNQDMIFAWTAAEDLDEWDPVSSDGTVTGAGFEQLADIGDYLSGLIVTSGTAFILRAQGISYATATGNATLPFAVNHIGLGDTGEGAQVSSLVCQYDNTGAYVGNTDLFQISGSISSIGQKIKQLFFSTLLANEAFLASNVCYVYIVDEVPLIFFLVGNLIFSYNTKNNTWQTFSLDVSTDSLSYIGLGTFATLGLSSSSDEYNQSSQVLVFSTTEGQYYFFSFQEGVPNVNSSSNSPTVTFPVEEVAFGRDITVDALYLSLWASVLEDVTITFYISIQQNIAAAGEPAVYKATVIEYASLTLTEAQFNTLEGDPIELQLFASVNEGVGSVTGHSPQLQYQISGVSSSNINSIRFSKIAMYCSFDPSQRPV